MPNSRIESSFISGDQLEVFGAWTTDGNSLQAGGNNILGSVDNFGWYFVTNNAKRGGWDSFGRRLLFIEGVNSHEFYKEKTVTKKTYDEFLDYVYSVYLPDNALFKFSIDVMFSTLDGLTNGSFRREIIAKTITGVSSVSKEVTPYTQINDKRIEFGFALYGRELRLNIKGLNEQINWSGKVTYQGVSLAP